jgi:hypothetical protein
MKRNLVSLLFILSISFAARAQYVAIPDSNLGAVFQEPQNTICKLLRNSQHSAVKQTITLGNAAEGVYTLMIKGKTGAVRVVR